MGSARGRLTAGLDREDVVDQLLHLRASVRVVGWKRQDPIDERDWPGVVYREVEKLIDEHHRQATEPAMTRNAAPSLEGPNERLQVRASKASRKPSASASRSTRVRVITRFLGRDRSSTNAVPSLRDLVASAPTPASAGVRILHPRRLLRLPRILLAAVAPLSRAEPVSRRRLSEEQRRLACMSPLPLATRRSPWSGCPSQNYPPFYRHA